MLLLLSCEVDCGLYCIGSDGAAAEIVLSNFVVMCASTCLHVGMMARMVVMPCNSK